MALGAVPPAEYAQRVVAHAGEQLRARGWVGGRDDSRDGSGRGDRAGQGGVDVEHAQCGGSGVPALSPASVRLPSVRPSIHPSIQPSIQPSSHPAIHPASQPSSLT
eukprot:353823-Chlamydomonas_euryale.AAC.3